MAVERAELPHLLVKRRRVGTLSGEAVYQRMLWRQQHERRAVDRVDARREDLDADVGGGHRERETGPFRAADPVPLHYDDLLGPFGQRLEAGQQLVGVGGDLEKPLLEVAVDDCRAAAPAGAVDDLFVRKHGVVDRAPVDRRALAVGQPALEHLQKDPLVELVVVGRAGGELTFPGVADAQPLELPLHMADVAEGRRLGVRAGFDGGVLGRQAEGIPPERVQHVEPAHPLHPGRDVANDVVADVTDMSVPRRVREHLQAVELRLRLVGLHLEGTAVGPLLLPFLVELLRLVLSHRGERYCTE